MISMCWFCAAAGADPKATAATMMAATPAAIRNEFITVVIVCSSHREYEHRPADQRSDCHGERTKAAIAGSRNAISATAGLAVISFGSVRARRPLGPRHVDPRATAAGDPR